MQKVVERPALPSDVVALAQQLQRVLHQYGYRLNGVAPLDGSEEFTAAITIPTASITSLGNYADDSAAATGGVPVNGLYRNGSVIQIRVS